MDRKGLTSLPRPLLWCEALIPGILGSDGLWLLLPTSSLPLNVLQGFYLNNLEKCFPFGT